MSTPKLLTLKSDTNKVGIKNSEPNSTLDINGDISISHNILSHNNNNIYNGSIITSNGISDKISLNRPYFIKVQLLNDDTGLNPDSSDYTNGYKVGSNSSNNSAQLKKQFSSTVYDFNNIDWNETDSEWTCPSTGIYRFTAQVSFSPANSDVLRSTTIFLYNSVQNEEIEKNKHEVQSKGSTQTSSASTIKIHDNFLQTIHYVSKDDKVELRAEWYIRNSTNMIIQGSSNNNSTYFIIERIINV